MPATLRQASLAVVLIAALSLFLGCSDGTDSGSPAPAGGGSTQNSAPAPPEGSGDRPPQISEFTLYPEPRGFFSTPYSDEPQAFLGMIARNIAAMAFYASEGKAPADGQVMAMTKMLKGPFDPVEYSLYVSFDGGKRPSGHAIKFDAGHFWSPETYESLTSDLFRERGVAKKSGLGTSSDGDAIRKGLLMNTAKAIAGQALEVSKQLQGDFANPEAHENAALLLGALALREGGEHFYDARVMLSRMTAHLAVARELRSGDYGLNGQIARAIIDVVANAEVEAQQRIESLNDPQAKQWKRVLALHNTYDYRLADGAEDLTPLEKAALFLAWTESISPEYAFGRAPRGWFASPVISRTLSASTWSVGIGHVLAEVWLPAELAESSEVLQAVRGISPIPGSEEFIRELNAPLNEGCFENGQPVAIPWGLWAHIAQRHLCGAIATQGVFLNKMLGVSGEAEYYRASTASRLEGLRLFPFADVLLVATMEEFKAAVDRCVEVVRSTPEIVPCGAWVVHQLPFWGSGELYHPTGDPNTQGWFLPSPVPGTWYDPRHRLRLYGTGEFLTGEDYVKRARMLMSRIPYEARILHLQINNAAKHVRFTAPELAQIFSRVSAYNAKAMAEAAEGYHDEPAEFERRMLAAAKLNPTAYVPLGNYFAEQGSFEKAAEYHYLAMVTEGTDHVTATHSTGWLPVYFAQKGDWAKAQEVAEIGLQVYSQSGLESALWYLELRGELSEALQVGRAIAERYGSTEELVGLLVRQFESTEPVVQAFSKQLLGSTFPDGIERVLIDELSGMPDAGVRLLNSSPASEATGFTTGDIIVASNGFRVRTLAQAKVLRRAREGYWQRWIVWNSGTGTYRELERWLPGTLLGVSTEEWRR